MTDHAAPSMTSVDAPERRPAQGAFPRRGWFARLAALPVPRWIQELVVVAASYGLYSLVRDAVPAQESAARSRAIAVFHLERALHMSFELSINHFLASVHWLAVISDYYYSTMHFIVTIAVLVWLYFRHPDRYRRVRSVLYATTLTALAVFWVFPMAPPRMLTQYGFIDTVVRNHTWGSWGSSGVAHVSNQFAAMPSLHMAWALWCAVVVIKVAHRRWVRVLAALYPVATLFVILGTANHFVLDAVAGAACLAIGFTVQRTLSGRPAFAVTPTPPATAMPR